jgi:DNA helicase-2/ATP-dependent DNA helicase PcrA
LLDSTARAAPARIRQTASNQSAIATKAGISERRSSPDESIMPAAATYLDTLNVQQRLAVEHGVLENDCAPRSPLLVIAGAGSGKTNTLAHRVAHLIVNGADPRRILMMTFSRRAASEMARRVERIARQVMGNNAGIMTDALTWAGTFHGIGARLLRDYAEQIGLNPAFTIHDREDSADLMNLARHELGFSKTQNRFPTKGTCLAIYSRCVNAESGIEQVLGTSFPWCAGWAAEFKQLFAAYVEAKQRQTSAAASTMCWSTSTRTPTACSPRFCWR